MIHILKPLFVLYRLEPFNIIGILAIKQIFQNDICIKKILIIRIFHSDIHYASHRKYDHHQPIYHVNLSCQMELLEMKLELLVQFALHLPHSSISSEFYLLHQIFCKRIISKIAFTILSSLLNDNVVAIIVYFKVF